MKHKIANAILLSIIPILLIYKDWNNPTNLFLGACSYLGGLGFGISWARNE